MHIGIIPDGNRRWAKENGKSPDELLGRWKSVISEILDKIKGKKISFDVFTNTFRSELPSELPSELSEIHIDEISFYVMSIDNVGRPDFTPEIIYALIKFISSLDLYYDFAIDIYGKIDMLPDEVQQHISLIVGKSNKCSPYRLNLAVAYDPIDDIKKFACSDNREQTQIDMVIRTGRERRSSGFFPCYTLYSEWFYTDVLWPDFNKDVMLDAIKYYKSCNRRFGK